MTPLRALLRERTSDAHRSLDAHLGAYDLDEDRSYGDFLAIQAGVVLPLERALEAAGVARLLPDWPLRARSAAIRADLQDLGRPAPSGEAIDLDRGDAATLLGATYVLEGSRLGARYLVRQRQSETATAFLRHGAEEPLWPRFIEVLEANEEAQRHPERMVAAARRVFELFQALAEARPPATT